MRATSWVDDTTLNPKIELQDHSRGKYSSRTNDLTLQLGGEQELILTLKWAELRQLQEVLASALELHNEALDFQHQLASDDVA